jgi:hypothetical protein
MPGESRMGEKDGHPMALRFSQATMQGGTLPLVSGVWICDRTGRAFGATYLTTATLSPGELLAAFEQYLAGLACH